MKILGRFYRLNFIHFNLTGTKITCADKLWAIAHMVNNEENLDIAVEAGANGLEMDLNFDESGNPTNLFHPTLCDCICHTNSNMPDMCRSPVCGHARPAETVMKYFMSHEKMGQVAMLYVDSKLDGVTDNKIKQAGTNVVKFYENTVLSRGYNGIIFISGNNEEYLRSSASEANQSTFKSQIFIGVDSSSGFIDGLKFVADMEYPNKMLSTGITACDPIKIGYAKNVVLGSVNKGRGVISDTIIWTLDRKKEYDDFYNHGARGIISNNIGALVRWAHDQGYELYTTDDVICGATAGSENLVTEVGGCGCEKKESGGCRINERAKTWGSACRCSVEVFSLGCKGDVVGCRDVTSYQCTNPNESEASCRQGGGNCDGY